jgi:hypothetical protein
MTIADKLHADASQLIADAQAATAQYRAALVDLEQMASHAATLSPAAARDHAARIRARATSFLDSLA